MKINLKNLESFLKNNFKGNKFNFTFREWDNSYSIRKANQKNVIAYYYINSQELVICK